MDGVGFEMRGLRRRLGAFSRDGMPIDAAHNPDVDGIHHDFFRRTSSIFTKP